MHKLLFFTLFFITIKTQSQEFTGALADQLDSQIEQYVDRISPGMAVGIVQDGKIVYQKHVGYSNLEHQIKISDNTRFNIASNAKQYTALCILQLVNDNKLDLDNDVRKYLPQLYTNIDVPITIANLLTHTSGIRDVYDLWALKGQTWWKLFIDNSDAIDLLKSQTDLNFLPGTAYLYSNSNYIILTEVIKSVSGVPFYEYSQNLFAKLGMPNTSFLTNYMTVIPNKARPYGNWGSWKEYPVVTEIHGDGALFTSIEDQLHYEKILQLNTGNILPKKLIAQSQSSIENVMIDNYGYGLMFGNYKGKDYAYHDGNTGAYNATFLRFPSQSTSIVVLSNNGNIPTNYIAKNLADLILNMDNIDNDYPGVPEEVELLNDIQQIVGIYKNEDGTIIKIKEKDGSIYRHIYQRDPVRLINENNGLFHYESNEDLKMNFTNITEKSQKLTIHLSSQEPSVYQKIDLDDSEIKNEGAINGRYLNSETDTEIIIEHNEGDQYYITKNGRKRKAELLLKDYLRMNSYEINITKDSLGNVTGLSVNNGRIKNVIFNKTIK